MLQVWDSQLRYITQIYTKTVMLIHSYTTYLSLTHNYLHYELGSSQPWVHSYPRIWCSLIFTFWVRGSFTVTLHIKISLIIIYFMSVRPTHNFATTVRLTHNELPLWGSQLPTDMMLTHFYILSKRLAHSYAVAVRLTSTQWFKTHSRSYLSYRHEAHSH